MAYKGYRCKICGGKTTKIDQGLTQCRKCGAITMQGTSWNKIIKGVGVDEKKNRDNRCGSFK